MHIGHMVSVPAQFRDNLDLDSLNIKNYEICEVDSTSPATGTHSTLLERLKGAQQNEQALSRANIVPPLIQNGGDHAELQLQFWQQQQQVQDLLDCNLSDERLLSESQLTQKSLIQGTINETTKQTAATATPSYSECLRWIVISVTTAACKVSTSSAVIVPFAVQECLNSLAVNGTSETVTSINSSTSQLPAKLVKEVLSVEFIKLSTLLPKTSIHYSPSMTNLSL